jgi:hypothetical protein
MKSIQGERVAMGIHAVRPKDIHEDEPLRLEVAAACAFPDGSMKASGLRREVARGRLIVERIAGKDYTTLKAIKNMRDQCRSEVRAPDFGFNQQADASPRRGSFATESSKSALAAARMKLQKLNEH